MANRVVRSGILESESVNKLTWAGEVFYRRLMSILDDFGRCDGRPTIIRSKLYPLRLDKVSEPDIVKWISECEIAGLIRVYHVDNKPYLELFNFGQTVRVKKARFPSPPCKQMQADASTCMSETETKTETEIPPAPVLTPPTPPPKTDDDYYLDGQQAFGDVQNDELMVERMLRVVKRSGFNACNKVVLMKAVRFFISIEEAKPDFTRRPRDEIKKHLVNWITSKAKTLNQYGG